MLIRSNIPQVQQAFLKLGRQVPYVTMVALNATADAFQRVQQESVLRMFVVRQRSFILNTIKRLRGSDFATKQNLKATVRIDPQRDQLAKFEKGGEKVAIQGKPYVAVPSHDLKRSKRGLVPQRFYPSRFKPLVDHPSGITTGQDGTFIVPTKGGNRLMLQDVGRTLKRLWLFVPSVTLPPNLHFYSNAIQTARSAWPSAVRDAWSKAIRTMR